eukprot:scaffold6355_cov119-Cylindrotheca_fusiformis.AAC.6
MLSSSVSRLTRQLATAHLSSSGRLAACPSLPMNVSSYKTFATNRKVIDAKNVRRLKIQAKKKKNQNKPVATSDTDASKEADQPFLQHQEWVKFQQSITVDGFQTGQVTTASVVKKNRGGKQVRRRKEKEMARLEQTDQVSDEKFPAIRYSQEETERLLAQAYGALPERAGKRGTRNLQRQENRWQLVRDIRAKYKANMFAAHERRMEKRHWKRQQVIAAKEQAPVLREKDLSYQAQVLRRWTETMYAEETPSSGDETGKSANIDNKVCSQEGDTDNAPEDSKLVS